MLCRRGKRGVGMDGLRASSKHRSMEWKDEGSILPLRVRSSGYEVHGVSVDRGQEPCEKHQHMTSVGRPLPADELCFGHTPLLFALTGIGGCRRGIVVAEGE
jgi:hypothetical protein